MRISFGTRVPAGKIHTHNGYGYATDRMLNSLQSLGYHVTENDASADVEIWFDQPHNWKFSKGVYKIGYHPWESTKLLPGWADIMNTCDEIWTPSPLIADWYRRYNGVRVPIYVYEHGIDHAWEPQPREFDGKVKFLHVGAEAARKGGWTHMVPLFREAFNNSGRNVQLTMKMAKGKWNGFEWIGRTHYINDIYTFDQLQDLFYEHHVYAYPSFGEGFGLTPLQAMATGMPTITVSGWAPYARLLDPHLSVGHTMVASPWSEIHPGQMLRPNKDEFIDALRYAVDHYEDAVEFAMKQTAETHALYDWDRLTFEAFSALENRLKR